MRLDENYVLKLLEVQISYFLLHPNLLKFHGWMRNFLSSANEMFRNFGFWQNIMKYVQAILLKSLYRKVNKIKWEMKHNRFN